MKSPLDKTRVAPDAIAQRPDGRRLAVDQRPQDTPPATARVQSPDPAPAPAPARPTRSQRYYERKTADPPICTRPGCRRRPAPDSGLCERHLRKARRASAKSHRRRRARLRDAGLCACGCGRKSDTWYADVCAIRLGRVPTPAVNSAVNHRPGPPRSDPWRRDNDGWKRFRGKGVRGNPPAEVKDWADLDEMTKTLERARVACQRAHSAEVAALGRIQRQAAMDEYLALLALLARYADGTLTRHGK